MYNIYNFVLLLSCSIFISLNKLLSLFLFSNDFFEAWKYVPFLLLSTVFSGLSQYISGLFTALKKTNIFARTSVVTAIINIVFNTISIPIIGPLGAAISTALAYFIMWGLRVYEIKKYMVFRINLKRDIFSYILVCLQGICLILFNTNMIINLEQFLFVIILIILYRKEIIEQFKKVQSKL